MYKRVWSCKKDISYDITNSNLGYLDFCYDYLSIDVCRKKLKEVDEE